MRFLNSRTLRYFGQRARELAHNFENAHHPYEERQGGRSWEDYYRRRWQHDKVVRSTHGVNCTGSCSFDVFVKDGIIVWEAQKTDYPTPHPDFPDYEPRGCPRGVSGSLPHLGQLFEIVRSDFHNIQTIHNQLYTSTHTIRRSLIRGTGRVYASEPLPSPFLEKDLYCHAPAYKRINYQPIKKTIPARCDNSARSINRCQTRWW